MSIDVVGLVVAALLGIAFMLAFGRAGWRSLFPGRWTPVTAQVVATGVETHLQRGHATRYSAHVDYRYAFGTMQGTGTLHLRASGLSRADAEAALRDWPVGHAFTVQVYRPDPRESRRDAQDGVGRIAAALLGLGLVVFAVVMLARQA